MSYQLTVNLVQKTPMIHFQYNQPGATLRATEVKPKLDRFLRGWCEKKNIMLPPEWLDATQTALRYKMHFTAEGTQTRSDPHRLFFGNMGEGHRPVEQISYPTVQMQLLCFCKERLFGRCTPVAVEGMPSNPTLLELLAFVLPAFFTAHCFGTRSGKGFGSFQCSEYIDAEMPCTGDSYLHLFYDTFYYIDYSDRQSGNFLNDIWVLSNMMKSGFNFTFQNPSDYYKGRIFRYYTEKGIGSDKAFIKQQVLPLPRDNSEDSEDKRENPQYAYKTFLFSRAMLGLAQEYNFHAGTKTKRSGTVTIKHKGGVIERFQSPVHFCVQENRLYLFPRNIPAAMFGAEFVLENKQKHVARTLRTPSRSEFNLIAYLDYFMQQFNSDTEIENFKYSTVATTIRKKLQIRRSPSVPSKGGVPHA